VLDLKPGQTLRDKVTVINAGGSTGTTYIYPVDATTGQTSGAVYLARTAPRGDVGSWIKLDASRVTLAPGEKRVVGYTIHVPANLQPGDHLGGIVAENARLTVGKGGSPLQIKIRHLTIVAVQVKIPGPTVAAMSIGRVKAGGGAGYQRVFVHLRNLGTVMLKPLGTLLLTDSAGRTVTRRTFQLDTFVPRSEIDYPVLIPGKALSPGAYHATVTLSYAGKSLEHAQSLSVSQTQYTQVFKGAPALTQPSASSQGGSSKLPWLVAGVAVVLVLGVFLYRRWTYYL
jgi:Protein of unknown function C-terminal (DUF3324)/Bacterial protein of unknown function (DUF916)